MNLLDESREGAVALEFYPVYYLMPEVHALPFAYSSARRFATGGREEVYARAEGLDIALGHALRAQRVALQAKPQGEGFWAHELRIRLGAGYVVGAGEETVLPPAGLGYDSAATGGANEAHTVLTPGVLLRLADSGRFFAVGASDFPLRWMAEPVVEVGRTVYIDYVGRCRAPWAWLWVEGE